MSIVALLYINNKCIQVSINIFRSPILVSIFTRGCRESLQGMIGTIDLSKLQLSESEKNLVKTDVDALINFSHLMRLRTELEIIMYQSSLIIISKWF